MVAVRMGGKKEEKVHFGVKETLFLKREGRGEK